MLSVFKTLAMDQKNYKVHKENTVPESHTELQKIWNKAYKLYMILLYFLCIFWTYKNPCSLSLYAKQLKYLLLCSKERKKQVNELNVSK